MPQTPKYSASKGRACYDIYIILYGAELVTLQLHITFTLQMCFYAAMPTLLKTRWAAGARGGSQSDLPQIQEENKYWPRERKYTTFN